MGVLGLFRAQWDRVLAVVATVLGFVMIVIGWIGVSGTGYLGKQLPYFMSSAVGGLGLIGVGAVLWLSADLRDEWRELRQLRVLMTSQLKGGLTTPLNFPAAETTSAAADVQENGSAGARRHASSESVGR